MIFFSTYLLQAATVEQAQAVQQGGPDTNRSSRACRPSCPSESASALALVGGQHRMVATYAINQRQSTQGQRMVAKGSGAAP
jgi:hypothetical protein